MRRFFSVLLFGLLLHLSGFSCYAQYYFRHYQTNDGLAQNSVTAIIQDSKGFIWIGTRGGLNRFDGYVFRTFKNKHNKFGSIGDNRITALAEDKNGMLWIGTGRGLFKYDLYKDALFDFESISQTYINDLIIDSENNIWLLCDNILYKYDQHKKIFENLHIEASSLTIDQNMNLWLGNDNGDINIYNSRNKTTSKINVIDQHVPANLRSISKIYAINNKEILIGCVKQGLKYYNRETGTMRTLPLQSDAGTDIYVRDIIAVGNQQYWVATESGVYIYDLKTNVSTHLHKRLGDPYAIADNAVYALCKDNQGGIWIGTYFGGLNYYSKQNARFEKYYPIPGVNTISGDAIGEICSDNKGNLWIGTEDAGINKLNLQSGKFTNYTSTKKPGDVSYPNIHGLLVLGNQLLIGPFLHGMEIMDIRTGLINDRFRFIGNRKDTISDFVISIYRTKDSTLLIGTAYKGSGLFSYDLKKKKFARIPQIPYNSSVFDIIEDHAGNIWTVSESQGAFFYNPKSGRHGNIRFGDTVKGKIINEFPVHNMLEDDKHAIWFSTTGGGLVKLSQDRKTVKKFNIGTGLPSNVLFGILEDNSKHLWIGSSKGLICFDTRTERCRVYTRANGLVTDQFNYNSAYKDGNGKMYFGTVKGMIAFNPKELDQKQISPPIYITDFQINNKEVTANEANSPLNKSILYTDTVILAYDQNNFNIEFASLNYSSPQVTRYKYLMNGLDKDWTYLNSNRNAYFTDLAPGKYVFIVQAESNVGSWTGKQRRLFIEILPPIWKSNVAYFIYLLILGAVFYFSIRYYHRFQERKNSNKLKLFEHEKEREVYESKIEFFTNIAHEIQTPLTLISVPVERVISEVDEYPKIKKNLLMIEKNTKRLVDLISQLLDFRQTEMEQFGLNFVNVNINKLLKEQTDAFRDFAVESKVNLKVCLPKNHIEAFVDREAFIKICDNLISNAIKYAASGATIEMMLLKPGNEKFMIRFCNDGKAIPGEFRNKIFEPFFRLRHKERPGTGIGLPLAKSLTDLHNGLLELVSTDADNIIFELTLPLHQKFEFKLSSWKKIR